MKKSILINLIFCTISISSLISCNKSQKDDAVSSSLAKTDSIIKVKTDSIPSNDLAENIKKVITTKYLQPNDLNTIDSTERKFSYQEIDLNNDGKKEIFISFFTPYFCGTGGCSLALLDSDLNIVNRFTVTETPLYISPDSKNGWNVIYVKSKGDWKALEYANGKYPSNPSVVKKSDAEPDPKSIILFKDKSDSKIYNF